MFLENKEAYIEKLFSILNPLLPYYSPRGARLRLGYTGATYSETVADAEAFIRVLWGLAPYLSGGGENTAFSDIYLRGLANGTDPNSDEYWGESGDNDQRLVEMAGIAVALLLAPDKFWTPLSDTDKDNLATWLNYANTRELVPNNWLFFSILVNVAFKKLGRPEFNQEVMDRYLAVIDSYYEGEGWYRDGELNTHDYYVAFAFHYYGLIYYNYMKDDDPDNANKFRDRALLFGEQFVYWFSDTGPSVPYGRSLTYRFAEVSFFSACIFAGIEPLPLATMKGIIDRHLEYWWGTHMTDLAGILSIGYAYPNLIMAESYNAPGSPMWALKTFILLALDDSNPYWSVEPNAFPVLDEMKYLPIPEMIVTQRPGNTVLYPNGQNPPVWSIGHIEEKYSKFAYSTKFGFSVRKANDCLENMAPDCDLVFEYQGLFYGRNSVSEYSVDGTTLTSRWNPLPGVEVTTVITPSPYGHTRRHTIVSSIRCTAYDCGFAFPWETDNYSAETDRNSAHVESAFGQSSVYVYTPSGSTENTNGLIIAASPNTNLLSPRCVIPAVSHPIEVGTTEILTTVLAN